MNERIKILENTYNNQAPISQTTKSSLKFNENNEPIFTLP
jgi:hypothetical protein